jgi:hypothetical protein
MSDVLVGYEYTISLRSFAPSPSGTSTTIRARRSPYQDLAGAQLVMITPGINEKAVATGGTFTAARGTWTVPAVSAAGTGVDATWAGIGGTTTTDLIQAGTQATVDSGVVQYSAWIETLPQASQTVPMTVNAGDAVTVSITQQSPGVWNITIQNATNGGSYTGTVNYSSSLSSAEWTEEAPTSGNRVVLLDQFGTVQFTNLSAVENQQTVTLGAAGATAVTMLNSSGVKLAIPSALGPGGASFSVTRG